MRKKQKIDVCAGYKQKIDKRQETQILSNERLGFLLFCKEIMQQQLFSVKMTEITKKRRRYK